MFPAAHSRTGRWDDPNQGKMYCSDSFLGLSHACERHLNLALPKTFNWLKELHTCTMERNSMGSLLSSKPVYFVVQFILNENLIGKV